jgi:hypothetical protein
MDLYTHSLTRLHGLVPKYVCTWTNLFLRKVLMCCMNSEVLFTSCVVNFSFGCFRGSVGSRPTLCNSVKCWTVISELSNLKEQNHIFVK